MKDTERWVEVGRLFPDEKENTFSGIVSLGILGEVRVLVRPTKEGDYLNIITKASGLPINQIMEMRRSSETSRKK